MKKILVIGSAGYIPEWWERNGEEYVKDGHKVCAINNAWKVCPQHVSIWIRAEDFFCIPNSVKPTEEQRSQWYEIVKTQDVPFSYSKGRTGGTMILNVICHFMNLCFESREKLWLAIAGSDLIYTGEDDHFYGQGNPDPMMFGKDFLQSELQRLKDIAEYMGYSIVNVGEQMQTLLPYARWKMEDKTR